MSHSNCWFFKQLFFCPQKNQDKPLTLSSKKNWGKGNWGGCGDTEPELSDYISLSLSLTPSLLSLFIPPSVFYHLLSRALS
ncbi:hypothetical protein UPYG_G00208010 [Umbra pygmaea]|uniref:Uncharacterized protein n=1 Tax=Umbra pygmaea TaxID=75934 RepID=A0ABD0WJE1_UMBPY